MRSPEMRKKRRERSVCAPHSRSAGTSIGPKLSFSMRLPLMAAVMLLLQQAAQHPCVFFMYLHALREQVERGFVVRLVGHRQDLTRRAYHGFLPLDQRLDHLPGFRHPGRFLD